tara:strand:+ start:397 stop:795 length:399 start_codon:yes stop_codon:yes gene_type:complete
MANTYLLLIDQLYIQPVQTPNPDEDGTEILDVITKIDYNYEATSPIGNIRKYHGTKIMPSPTTAEGYFEYKDVTYEIAQSWVKNSEEDEEIIYRLLDTQIEEQEKEKFVVPGKLPWEELPPGQQEIDAQNED